ncbi:MAG TPA: aspartate aminotransferase family protein [Candidatus Acidoferrum sp.]|nr:aspartate aminotransferase family protein [Candidatus Acidoferrum sp.]
MSETGAPFFHTWCAQRGARGREVVGGEGAWFRTADGGRWLDLGSLSYHAHLGHGCPRMIAAIERQARELCLAAAWADYPAKRQLAERLLALAPPGFARGKVFFTLGGSEAIENAMKIARLATGRLKFVARYRSYHGASLGALSLSGDYRRPPLEPLLPGVLRLGSDDADALAEILAGEEGTVAAVVLEPIPGANGVHIPPPGFFAGVRAACDRHGALLVCDEVLTGLGRTGRALAVEHEGIEPDLITLAKGLTAGYAPLGAVLASERVARHFDDEVLWAGLTNYAHPLGCAAGREALAIYREERLFERAAALEPALLRPLAALADRFPVQLGSPRGRGLLAAIDAALDPAAWNRLAVELERRRLHVHTSPRRGTIILAPPLVIGEDELARGLDELAAATAAAIGGAG